jgi:hypothetical protein
LLAELQDLAVISALPLNPAQCSAVAPISPGVSIGQPASSISRTALVLWFCAAFGSVRWSDSDGVFAPSGCFNTRETPLRRQVHRPQDINLIVLNANVRTVDPQMPSATALAAKGGRFAAIGINEEAKACQRTSRGRQPGSQRGSGPGSPGSVNILRTSDASICLSATNEFLFAAVLFAMLEHRTPCFIKPSMRCCSDVQSFNKFRSVGCGLNRATCRGHLKLSLVAYLLQPVSLIAGSWRGQTTRQMNSGQKPRQFRQLVEGIGAAKEGAWGRVHHTSPWMTGRSRAMEELSGCRQLEKLFKEVF